MHLYVTVPLAAPQFSRFCRIEGLDLIIHGVVLGDQLKPTCVTVGLDAPRASTLGFLERFNSFAPVSLRGKKGGSEGGVGRGGEE